MKRSTRIIAVAAGTFVAVAVFTATLARGFLYAVDTEVPAPSSVVDNAPKGDVLPVLLPSRLVVPVLDVDAPVEEVGIAKSGNMGVPKSYDGVGWYKYGTVPGQKGSAVFAGHVDNGFGLAGVFKHLNDVAVGDDMYVVTEGNVRLRFVVEEVKAYPYDAVPTDELFNRKDVARLNLVTCTGEWLSSKKTYNERLIVYARLAPGTQ